MSTVTVVEHPHRLPPWIPPVVQPAKPPKNVINSVASKQEDTEVTVAAGDDPIPVGYGPFRTGPMLAQAGNIGSDTVFLLIWCIGEIESVEKIVLSDGTDPDPDIEFTHYTGTLVQPIDPVLSVVFPGWVNRLRGEIKGEDFAVAYSVARIPKGKTNGVPQFVAYCLGKKVFDPRDQDQIFGDRSTWKYSDNAAVCLADFQLATLYGRGRKVNWDSVAIAADANDEIIEPINHPNERRRTLGLVMNQPASADNWSETLRAYAGCFVVEIDGEVHLVPDRPVDTSDLFHITDDMILADKSGVPRIDIKQRDELRTPSVVHVEYTSVEEEKWRTRRATAKLPGVDEGFIEWTESVVQMPGIYKHSQADRESTERLNYFTVSDLEVSLQMTDEGMRLVPGQVVKLSHWLAFVEKLMRIIGVSNLGGGNYQVDMVEYQPNNYSDEIQSAPALPDTTFPDPLYPPLPTDLVIDEKVFKQNDNTYSSRFVLSCTKVDFAYVTELEWQVWDGQDLVYQTPSIDPLAVTPSVEKGVYYTIRVRSKTSVGGTSQGWLVGYFTAEGNLIPPPPVPWFDVIEVGDEVRARWGKVDDIGGVKYELRYGPVGAAWADMKDIDTVSNLTKETKEIPAGTWDCAVMAVDPENKYSSVKTAPGSQEYIETETRKTVVVTLDKDAFLIDQFIASNPTLSNVTAYKLHRLDPVTHYVTDHGETASSVFTGDLTTYTGLAAGYHSGGTSELLTEMFDAELVVGGTWRAFIDLTTITGVVEAYLELSADGVTWEQYAGLSAIATARYARVRIITTGSATMATAMPGITIRIDAQADSEVVSGTTAATGPTTVTLDKHFARVLYLSPAPVAAGYPVDLEYDNIQTGVPTTVDYYAFHRFSGEQVAVNFTDKVEGIG